jgi:hypothetical protein
LAAKFARPCRQAVPQKNSKAAMLAVLQKGVSSRAAVADNGTRREKENQSGDARRTPQEGG